MQKSCSSNLKKGICCTAKKEAIFKEIKSCADGVDDQKKINLYQQQQQKKKKGQTPFDSNRRQLFTQLSFKANFLAMQLSNLVLI